MEAKDIGSVQASRIDQALQGKTSGVYIAQTSGSPGAAMSVKIRGNSSNGKNDPLYIVDGIKTSGIDFLSPNDIESVEVLKDSASSAIYGSEGGNGVIIVTTKRAQKGVSEISYNYYHGIQSVSNYVKMMSGTEYIDYMRQAYVSEFALDPTMPKYISQMKVYAKWDSTNANTNWMSKIINTAPVDEHNLSFSSANEKGQMFLSGTYYSQDGIVGGAKNNYTRYNFNFNGDTKIKDWLTVGARVSYTHSKKNNLNESSEFGGIVSDAMFFDPTVPVYYNDISELPSNVQNDPARLGAMVKNADGKYFHLSNTTLGEAVNPLAQIYNTHNSTTTDKLLGNINAEIKFLKDFTFNMKLAVDYSLIYNNIFSPKYYYSEENLGINDTTNSNVRNTYQKLFRYTYENYLTYKKTFGDHSIEALAGFSYEKFTPSYLDVTSFGVPHNDAKYAYFYNTLNSLPNNIPLINGGMGTINVTDPSVINNSAGGVIVNNYSEILNSYFGRVTYNYKEKYLIQGNIRRDASSLFGPAYRSGIFPSFSLGWNISREKFFTLTTHVI